MFDYKPLSRGQCWYRCKLIVVMKFGISLLSSSQLFILLVSLYPYFASNPILLKL